MKKTITVKVSFEERKNFLIRVPLLPGCVAAFIKNNEMNINEIAEKMVEEYLKDLRKNKIEIPEEFNGEYVLEYVYTTEAYLNYFDRFLPKSSFALLTGINENQLWYYSSGLRQPRKDQKERIISGMNNLEKALERSTII
ncbi:hypothetical protein AGMMS50239_26540 [Bacteroidia bacterium]|nr:hypothetical protein FACS1894207_2830 [Bacteroidia bacterium]GHT65908.1 hypothetical protein AGMMS50239_26540 [Bacteroidia bacterium]